MTLLALGIMAVGVAIMAWTGRAPAPSPGGEAGPPPPSAPASLPPTALAGRLGPGASEQGKERPSAPETDGTGDGENLSSGAPAGDPGSLFGESIVSGRLVDRQGRPLGGIPVYVALATRKGYVLSDQRFLWLEGPDADGGRATARKYGGAGVTSASGDFGVDASFARHISNDGGRVRVVPSHPAWMEPRIVTGEEGGEIRAEPAASLAVRVVDEDGVSMPEFRAVVREAGRGVENHVVATHGGFVVQWRRREGVSDEIRASIAIWAKGRAIARRDVTIPADRQEDSITLVLGPIQRDGQLVLRSPATTEADGVRAIVVVLALGEGPDDELLRVRMAPIDPRRHDVYVADLPPGRFRVRAFVIEPSREGWILDETIEITSGTTTDRTWAAPTVPAQR